MQLLDQITSPYPDHLFMLTLRAQTEGILALPNSVGRYLNGQGKLMTVTAIMVHTILGYRADWIGGTRPGNAVFVPPPPERVSALLGDMERFIHDGASDCPPMVKVALIHAQFETIHPFVDGNGRLGRLLITFLLCERTVLGKPVLYVSLTLKRRREEYYRRLQAVRDDGAWEEWLIFFLDCVAEAALDAARLAKSILSLREAHRDAIVNEMGARAGKAIRLLERLYRDPYIEVNEAVRVLGVSYANANTIVWDMESLGILREATGQQRNRIFVYEDYIALFREL
jgi:Fic family protein